MKAIELIKLVCICIGIFLMVRSFLHYAHQRMKSELGLSWGVVAMVFIAVGIGLSRDIELGYTTAILGSLLLIAIVGIIYHLSRLVSILEAKTRELALQVSLLNQENGILQKQYRRKSKEDSERD